MPSKRWDNVLNILKLLKTEGEVTEVRILNTPKGTISGYFDNQDLLAKEMIPYDGKYNIYMTLNPVKAELLARANNRLKERSKNTTTDSDIVKRTKLYIDIDPIRPSGISSTESEHKSAIEAATKIANYLTELGWTRPIVGDSGNGANLLYQVDLPNNSESTELIKNILYSLDFRFSNESVEVDISVHNAARIVKIPGTTACKGDNTDDRPHRESMVLEMPDVLEPVPIELLQKLAEQSPKINKTPRTKNATADREFNLDEWLINNSLEFSKGRWQNKGTKYVFNKCPWNEEHTDKSAYIIKFDDGAISAGCHHNSCSHESWQTLRKKFEPDYKEKSDTNEKENKTSQADLIINLGRKAEYFKDELGESYVIMEVNGHEETHKVTSKNHKLWLTKKFYESTGKAPTNEAITQAIGVMEMKALFSDVIRKLEKRCAFVDDVIYYDLCNPEWEVVKITKHGWSVTKDYPPIFIRSKNMKQQVTPLPYSDLSILDKYYRYKDNKTLLLQKVHLVASIISNIGRPIQLIYGEKGAAKTTTMRINRSIIDPAVRDILSLPNSKEDLALTLVNNYMPSYDNLDNISAEKSDMFCIAVTGGGISKRKLHTDDEEIILEFRKQLQLNGIDIVAKRADLLDRCILYELERIPENERKEESLLWSELERDKPQILGAIFTILSKAMGIYPNVQLEKLGRLADFTRWGYAIAEAAELSGEKFLEAYLSNQEKANEEAITSNPVALGLIQFMKDKCDWKGTVTQLLFELNRTAQLQMINTNVRLWPKEAHVLSRRLNEIKSNLEKVNIQFYITPNSDAKIITVIKNS